MLSIKDLREHYGKGELLEKDLTSHPVDLFDSWFRLALDNKILEPNAMVLSTIGLNGTPRSRVMLLKEFSKKGFVFFTNYESEKGREINKNPNVCLNFVWLAMEKQVRIEGVAEKVSEAISEEYFNSRPLGSRIGAVISKQSQPVSGRDELEQRLKEYSDVNEIKKPEHWGGYEVKPSVVEFWQGRADRLHDRIQYKLVNDLWIYQRLQP